MNAQTQEPSTFKWQPRHDRELRMNDLADFLIGVGVAFILVVVLIVGYVLLTQDYTDHGYSGYEATPVEVGR